MLDRHATVVLAAEAMRSLLSRPRPMNLSPRGLRVTLLIALAVGLLVRLSFVGSLGFANDVQFFQAQAERLRQVGPADFYSPDFFSDYPPAYLSLLGGVAWLIGGMPAIVFKASSIPFDLAIAVTLYLFLRRLGNERAGVIAASLYLLNPAVIYAGPYWGQTDAAGTLPFLLALVALGFGRFGLAGALAGLALMAKLQYGLAALPVGAIALLALLRERRVGPIVRAVLGGGLAFLAFALPFRLDIFGLLARAAETYPYTSLYAFNTWAILGGFWRPDAESFVRLTYQAWSTVLFAFGLLGTFALLWRDAPHGRRWGADPARDLGLLLAVGVLISLAFYFLPTRVHERYLFPVFALLAPFAALRTRALVAYLALSAFFFLTLLYAFTRFPENATRAPDALEATLYQAPGIFLLTLVGMVSAAWLAWSWWRHRDYVLVADRGAALPAPLPAAPPGSRLPAGLLPGRAPTRRDYIVALLVALTVLATRGYRLDQPRDMYFDEVYHARTAFELLAQREPYEWTHPHLAKEIMALGILAFGGDRVVGHEDVPTNVLRFAVTNDGARIYTLPDAIEVRDRAGALVARHALGDSKPLALAVEGDRVIVLGDRGIAEFPARDTAAGTLSLRAVPVEAQQVRALVAAGGRVVLGGETATFVFATLEGPPVVVRTPSVAIAAKPDGSELYLLDPQGSVHVVDPQTGVESRSFASTLPGTAIAYADGPKRLFVARADEPSLDVIELEGGRRETVPLANDRTGAFAAGATALAVVPRTQFLYALADGRLVVVETHGASPYAAIPTTASRLGVDGTGDALLLQGADRVELVETGRHALAWRLPGVVFGAILAFFLVLLARRLFASPLVAAFTGALLLLDGSMFAQPRIGMNDVYAGAFLVAAWYFVVAAHAPRRSAAVDLLAAGALFGLALASKWVAAYAIAALALLSIAVTVRAFERGRRGEGGPLDLLRWRGLNAVFLFGTFAVIPIAIYLLSYRPWFGGPMEPFGWDLVELTKQMYWYHSGLASSHPAGSPWWSWPLVLKPVYWYYGATEDGGSAVIYDAGNVVIFWAALAATVWCAIAAVRARSVSLGFVVFALLAQLVSWIPITRVLFFYHFFTALPYYLLALAAALALLWERGRRRLVAGYLVVAGLAFVFFYPFVSGQPVPADETGIFFILPTWQYGCQFYPSFSCDLSGTSRLEPAAVLARVGIPLALGLLVYALSRLPSERIRTWLGERGPS